MTQQRRVTGVVLAAGAGTRMGTPKADLTIDGTRLLDRAAAVLRAAGCDDVIAVVREGTTVTNALGIVNHDPDRGMRSSLQLAIDAVTGEPDAIAVMLVDTPGIDATAARSVIDAWQPNRIAVGDYDGRRGHPTVMSPALWRAALELAGEDEGANRLLKTRADLVDEIPTDGDPTDLDTQTDLARWNATRLDQDQRNPE